MENLSEAAMKLFLSIPGYAQGASLPIRYSAAESRLRSELFEAGLIGPGHGLTRKGSILAQRLKREEEERLFAL